MKYKALKIISVVMLFLLILSTASCANTGSIIDTGDFLESSGDTQNEVTDGNSNENTAPDTNGGNSDVNTKPDHDTDGGNGDVNTKPGTDGGNGDSSTDSDNKDDENKDDATHVCASNDNDHKCDKCNATISECADGNGDNACDICKTNIPISLFANNVYNVKFVRSATPTALDNKVYNEICAIFKNKTGIAVSAESESYTGPAIVIGTTSYTESKNENAGLEYGSGSAKLIGNKYVITYSNAVAAAKMLTRLRALIGGKSADAIELDNTWNISFTDVESRVNQTFDSTGIVNSAELPKYEGSALTNGLYAGHKSYVYVKTGATLQNFDNYCAALYLAGYTYYTNNQIGENRFATYVTQTQIVNVEYFSATKEIRIATDNRGKGNGANAFDLPALSGDVSYTKSAEPSLTMVDLSDTGYAGGMCFIYKLPNGKFFIVDSGINKQGTSFTSSAPIIYNTLKSLAGSEKITVAGWLITHVHSDHLGGLYDMATAEGATYDKIRANVTIEQLIHGEPADAVTQTLDELDPNSTADYKKIWAWMNPIANAFNIKSVIKAHPGQVLHYAGIDITVLASQDVVLDIHDKYPNDREPGGNGLVDSNDLSVITQISFNGKKILMLGDALQKENTFIAKVYGKELKSDILQAAHHGLNKTGADTSTDTGNPNGTNQLCAPDITLWARGKEAIEYVVERCPINKYLIKNTVGYGAHDGNVTFDSKWKTANKPISEYPLLNNNQPDY